MSSSIHKKSAPPAPAFSNHNTNPVNSPEAMGNRIVIGKRERKRSSSPELSRGIEKCETSGKEDSATNVESHSQLCDNNGTIIECDYVSPAIDDVTVDDDSKVGKSFFGCESDSPVLIKDVKDAAPITLPNEPVASEVEPSLNAGLKISSDDERKLRLKETKKKLARVNRKIVCQKENEIGRENQSKLRSVPPDDTLKEKSATTEENLLETIQIERKLKAKRELARINERLKRPNTDRLFSNKSAHYGLNDWKRDQIKMRWAEVQFILRENICSDDDIEHVAKSNEKCMAYINLLSSVSEQICVRKGQLSQWLLPFNSETCVKKSPLTKAKGCMPSDIASKISSDDMKMLLEGACALRSFLQLKIADDNDINTAKNALLSLNWLLDEVNKAAERKEVSRFEILCGYSEQ
mmetsp:Transcript_18855/g.27809  ORF Transcript_18855/g.27809 Transcript_18855/m.27809 type:complete len:409 (+) Transcript_18855:102-1328(+)